MEYAVGDLIWLRGKLGVVFDAENYGMGCAYRVRWFDGTATSLGEKDDVKVLATTGEPA